MRSRFHLQSKCRGTAPYKKDLRIENDNILYSKFIGRPYCGIAKQ